MITEDSIIVAETDLAIADLDGEAVILSRQSNHYYGLNQVGTRIFELARQPRSVREILTDLTEEYDVEHEQLMTDLIAFLQDMMDKKLVRMADADYA